jgi:hypothetical protein
MRGCHGRDHVVVGFKTIYTTNVVSSKPAIQHYVIKFVSDLRQISGFPPGIPVSSTNKTDGHDITEILLKVALNTINQTKTN